MALDCSLVLLQIMLLVWTIKASKPLMCQNSCGDFQIQYPFGIGEGCYFNKSFEVVCDHSSGSPKRLLKSINLELSEFVTFSGSSPYVEVNVSVISLNNSCNDNNAEGVNLTGTPFSFEKGSTAFTATECNTYAKLNQRNDSSGSCFSICTCDPTQKGDYCCDFSCSIPPNRKVFDVITLYNYAPSIQVPLQECNSVTMVDRDWLFRKYRDNT